MYLYDESSIIGMEHTVGTATTRYYFQRNLQGDVVAIYNANGVLKAKYLYDAWGNCTISSETTDYVVANANPIRYRGYYYDDTGLYYCNARYYSPKWRRFISPDDTAYLTPESVNGLNLYCYCGNDPINRLDSSGHKWYNTIWNWMTNAVDAITGFCSSFFGVGVVIEDTYEYDKIHTIWGDIDSGLSTAKTIAGDVSKPVSLVFQCASRWWILTEYKIGVQINIGDGGFSWSYGLGGTEWSVSFGTGWTLEVFCRDNKKGITISYGADFGTHEATSFFTFYYRPISTKLVVCAAVVGVYALPALAPALAVGGAVVYA